METSSQTTQTFPVTSSLLRSRFVATHTLFRVSAISDRGLTVGAPFWHRSTGWLELILMGHIDLNSGSGRSSCVCLFLNKLYPTTKIALMVACNSYHFAKWLFRFFFHLFSFSSAVSPLFYRMQSCISSDNGGPGNCQSLAPWRPRSLKCS